MSFSKLEAIGAARNNPTGVTASIWGRRGGALRLSLSFSAACLRSLSVDDPFAIGWRVFVGEGDDFGRLKLAVDSDGEFRLTRSKNGVARLHLGPVAWIADAPRDAIAHAIRSLLALLVGTIDEETECEHCRALRARATTAIAAFGGAQEVDDDPLADVRGHG